MSESVLPFYHRDIFNADGFNHAVDAGEATLGYKERLRYTYNPNPIGGKHGIAEIFAGTDWCLADGTPMALKVVEHYGDEELMQRARKEFDTLVTLRHPNIIEPYNYFVGPEQAFIIMELGNINDIYNNKNLSQIILDIAGALDHAHDYGIVHRDVKPGNILFGRDGKVKLADFGACTAVIDATKEKVGTPAYMAPEQISGKTVPQSDQYALALTLYELLTGKIPAMSDSDTLEQIMQSRLKLNPKRAIKLKNKQLKKVLCKALAQNPEDRYNTVTEFAEAATLALQK